MGRRIVAGAGAANTNPSAGANRPRGRMPRPAQAACKRPAPRIYSISDPPERRHHARRRRQGAGPDVHASIPHRAAQVDRARGRVAGRARHRALSPAGMADRRGRDLGRGGARPAGARPAGGARLGAGVRARVRPVRRRDLPDAGRHRPGGELLRRRDRRARRAAALSARSARRRAAARPRDPRGRQDGGAGDRDLSRLRAVPAVCRLRRGAVLRRHRLAARPRIFRSRRDAVPSGRGGQGAAAAARRHGVRRRPVHRRLRGDPDRQPGDAAVRHRLHGAHAQAARRAADGPNCSSRRATREFVA